MTALWSPNDHLMHLMAAKWPSHDRPMAPRWQGVVYLEEGGKKKILLRATGETMDLER